VARLTFVIDQNVQDAVGNFLKQAGHDARLVRQVLTGKASDPAIVAYATMEYAIVITHNHRHFHTLAQHALEPGNKVHRTWGLLSLTCQEAHAADRIRHLLTEIEAEYELARRRYPDDLLLHMQIDERHYVIYR
jgi:predicted nuclease of predicted toxin-antitoxin system